MLEEFVGVGPEEGVGTETAFDEVFDGFENEVASLELLPVHSFFI